MSKPASIFVSVLWEPCNYGRLDIHNTPVQCRVHSAAVQTDHHVALYHLDIVVVTDKGRN